ncbi:MAG: hypothetical protein B7Z04_11260 [Rhodobacterales bacterium 32-66-9]|nr:MAG: hypothetical protein B7Z04_11260 [Rhodobacterales bacterium 32-66-9]
MQKFLALHSEFAVGKSWIVAYEVVFQPFATPFLDQINDDALPGSLYCRMGASTMLVRPGDVLTVSRTDVLAFPDPQRTSRPMNFGIDAMTGSDALVVALALLKIQVQDYSPKNQFRHLVLSLGLRSSCRLSVGGPHASLNATFMSLTR